MSTVNVESLRASGVSDGIEGIEPRGLQIRSHVRAQRWCAEMDGHGWWAVILHLNIRVAMATEGRL